MSVINFHWKRSDITPDLLMAVGAVMLNWSMVDDQISNALIPFWVDAKPNERIPRSFDRRINGLVDLISPFYSGEPDEYRIFMWFIQRIKDANGRRDNIAHGIPGTITKKGRTYKGLMIPEHSREATYSPMPFNKITELAETIDELITECGSVTSALWAVRSASRSERIWRESDGWKTVTMDNRSPKLPCLRTPPQTFVV